MTDNKHFDEWNLEKQRLHFEGRRPAVKQGEVWWCAVGQNVGVEIDGKGSRFVRPVLVYKKLSRLGFLGIPLTTQTHDGNWYVPFVFQSKQQFAVLAQARAFSILRIYRRMGTIPENDFDLVIDGFRLSGKNKLMFMLVIQQA